MRFDQCVQHFLTYRSWHSFTLGVPMDRANLRSQV
jgi:hypothetical protein